MGAPPALPPRPEASGAHTLQCRRGLRHYRRDGVGNVLAGEYRTDVVT